MNNKTTISSWLQDNATVNNINRIKQEALATFGVSQYTIANDLTGRGYDIPELRKQAWLNLIQKYNPNVTIEDLFPTKQEATNA